MQYIAGALGSMLFVLENAVRLLVCIPILKKQGSARPIPFVIRLKKDLEIKNYLY